MCQQYFQCQSQIANQLQIILQSQQVNRQQTSQKRQKFKWGLYHFQQLFFEISLKKMRSMLTKHLGLGRAGWETNRLVFRNVYYARSSKRNQQLKKQQQNNPQPDQGNDNNQQPQDQNPQNPTEPTSKLTGPKRLTQLLKSGNPNLIPFYLNHMINTITHPSLPSSGLKHTTKTKQPTQQQKSQGKQQATRTEDELLEQIVKNNFRKKPQGVEDGVRKEDAKPLSQPQYPFKSSQLYKQRLMKKYKIVQSLRSTTKQSQQMQLLSLLKLLRQFDLSRLLTDPNHRNLIIRTTFYIALFFLSFYMAGKSLQKPSPPVDLPFHQQTMNDNQIQSKVSQIKEIKVRPNSNHNNQVMIVLNKERELGVLDRVVEMMGFEVERNQMVRFDSQNPNLILDGLEKVQENKQNQDWVKIKPVDTPYTLYDAFWDTLFLATPFLGLAITYWIFKKVNPDSMLKGITSNKKSMKIQSTKDIKVRFKDVAGMQNAKKQITEFVDFLKHSDKYAQIGAKIPKGALLTGPPGTGKTMLAKACAGQAGTSFFYVSGSQFVQMFVGVGASRVRQLFSKARQQAPSIIFIDEIDAIGKKRQTSRNEEKDSTLNQMLVEMDGFSTNQTVIVLAATNRKDILDSALTRPGRFDRMVEITLPQIKAREQIFMVHLSPLKVNPTKPLNQIAKRLSQLTPGFSGADIANLCNQAAIIATRKKRQYIEDADFEQASQRIMAGYVKKGLSNEKTKKRVAYHESGHAVCGWYLRGGDPLVKLTIIPRSKGALGYAQYLPKTAHIRTKSQLIDQISIMLGGTTAQQIFLGNMSSGNSDDLQKVYRIARSMITQFGMGAKTYNMTLDEQTYVKKESEQLCNLMDQEMLDIVKEATQRARQIIQDKREIVEQLAKELLQKETINNEDILRIMGARPVFN